MRLASRRHLLGWGGGIAAATILRPSVGGSNQTRQITDSAGRRIELPAQITRVFAAGPPAAIILYTLAPDTLIGWTRAFDFDEQAFIPEHYAKLPGLGRLTGRGNTANIEAVLAAKPDVVFDYGSIAPTFVSLADRVQQQTGVPYVLVDGSFGAIEHAYTVLGAMVGDTKGAADLITATRAILAKVDSVLARQTRHPRIYYARGPNGLNTGLGGSINVECLERLGAINVAAQALGRGGLVTVSLEQVLTWNPEIIVTSDDNFYRAVGNDLAWRGIDAVKNRRVYLSPGLPFGWVDFPPSVNRLIGLLWLLAVLYPESYPGSLRQDVAAFYDQYYHRRPTDAQLDSLLVDSRGLRP